MSGGCQTHWLAKSRVEVGDLKCTLIVRGGGAHPTSCIIINNSYQGRLFIINVVYFHGYGSSPNSDKVDALRNKLKVPVFAFPANIDPEIAIREVSDSIDMLLLEDMHAPDRMLFVGTSLGGWLASELGNLYDIPVVVINPSYEPFNSLKKYGVDEDICNKYTPLKLSKKNTYFFAENDTVIDNVEFRQSLINQGYRVYIDPDANHSFSGKPFERVVEYITHL